MEILMETFFLGWFTRYLTIKLMKKTQNPTKKKGGGSNKNCGIQMDKISIISRVNIIPRICRGLNGLSFFLRKPLFLQNMIFSAYNDGNMFLSMVTWWLIINMMKKTQNSSKFSNPPQNLESAWTKLLPSCDFRRNLHLSIWTFEKSIWIPPILEIFIEFCVFFMQIIVNHHVNKPRKPVSIYISMKKHLILKKKSEKT